MRRARSQLSKLTHQQAVNQGLGGQEGYNVTGSEVDEIQRRLNALELQQAMPSPGLQQPLQTQVPPQPAVNPYAASAPHLENRTLYGSQKTGNPQLDNIRSALEQMTSKLHSMNNAGATASAGPTTVVQQNDILKQHYDGISSELQELKQLIGEIAPAGNSEADLNIIKETLSANYRAIMQELERSKSSGMDSSLFSAALEASHKELSQQIIDMKKSVDATINNPNAYAKTLEVSHGDISKRLDEMYQALQSSIATPDSYVDAIENTHHELLNQVQQLQKAVEKHDPVAPGTVSVDLSSIEMRLEEITRAVVALSLNDGSVNNLERIEARVSDMAKTLDGFNASGAAADNSGFERLEAKLADIESFMQSGSPDLNNMETQIGKLSEKLENLSSVAVSAPLSGDENNALLKRMDELVDQMGQSQSQSQDSGANEAMVQQLEQISSAIEKLSSPVAESDNGNGAGNDLVMQQLEQIAGAIDQLAMPSSQEPSSGSLASIEQQLSEISSHLSSTPPTGKMSLDPIANRLTGIEEQLGANRDITIELASKIAEDAVNKSVQAMPQAAGEAQLDTSVLSSMTDLLAQLNNQAEVSNSSNMEAFGAVTQTLDMMVESLGRIESGLTGQGIPQQALSNPEPQPAPENLEQPTPEPMVAEPVQQAPEPLPEPVQQAPEPEPQSEEQPVKSRNPAADLVKAARQAAEASKNKVPEPEIEVPEPEIEPVVEDPVVAEETEEVAPALDDTEYNQHGSPEIDTSELPTVETPTMAMDTMPEVQNEQHQEANPDVALEPGSGGPDLAALVRQANEQRKNNRGTGVDSSGTEFIAAARRAAQAAAQEAGVVEEEIEEKTKKGLLASIPDLFAKRKKVIIMAAAAALFAVIAIPLTAQFMGSNDAQVAKVQNEVELGSPADDVPLQASTVPAENTVTPIEPATESDAVVETEVVTDSVPSNDAGSAEDSSADLQPVEQPLVQEVNLATVNLNENPAPASFVLDEELKLVSPELKAAVQNGDPAALFEIGKRYTDGVGYEKDLKKAAEWYERAANLGFAPAQYIIGNFNEKGLGVEKNAVVAAQWYEQAARGGNVIAMHNLAVLTATPNALSEQPNMGDAFKWFSNAADYGVRDSQVNAGIFHTKGLGTEVNLVEAYKWFAIAAKAGDKDAGNKRDVIANAIPPDQLEIAKALVTDWKPLEVVQAANEVLVTEAWKAPVVAAAAPEITIDRSVIAQTQLLLSKVGFNAGVADGIMGQKTRNAIAAFQQKAGLPVNGRIDGEFLKALKAVAI